MTDRAGIGDRPKRREDQRFLTGRGRYLDDLAFDGLAHAVVLRSPHAHARIAAYRRAGGARGAGRARRADRRRGRGPTDCSRCGPRPRPTPRPASRLPLLPQPLLAEGKVRYVGEPVALIVAETRDQALDAAELVAVDYAPLPAVTDRSRRPRCRRAADRRRGAGQSVLRLAYRRPRRGRRQALPRRRMSSGCGSTITASSPTRWSRAASSGCGMRRPAATPPMCRAQSIHNTRDHAARALGCPGRGGALCRARCRRRLWRQELCLSRARADPVGGKTGRPAGQMDREPQRGISRRPSGARPYAPRPRWRSTRRAGFWRCGVDSIANVGAYLAGSAGGVQTFQYALLPGTVYRIPAIALAHRGGADQHRADRRHPRTRLCRSGQHHRAADRQGGARMRLRPRRAAPPQPSAGGGDADDQRVWQQGRQRRLSRDLRPGARRAPMSPALPRGAATARRAGGCAASASPITSRRPAARRSENVDIRFEADGTVALITGTQTIGQGHETTFPQILADRLGVPNEQIRLVQGDTDLIPMGGGHGSSRATYMGGTAIWRASDEIIAKGTRIAAEVLEAAEADIRFADGDFVVAGTDRRVRAARGRRGRARQGHAARHLLRLDAGVDDLPQRHPRRRGRDRSRHRPGDAGALYRGRRLRRAGQPDDRRGAGAWRDRAGRRPGVARTRGLRRRNRASSSPARLWTTRCRAPTTCRPSSSASTTRAARPTRSASKAAARQGRSPPFRRSPTRSSTRSPLWRERARGSGFVRADLAYDRRLRTGYGRQEAAMNLFERYRVADAAAAAERIPVIDYGPYFAGEKGALERVGGRGRARLREHRLFLCAEPRRAGCADRPRFCRLAPVLRVAARTKARARAQREQYRLSADQRLGAGRLDRAQGDKAQPERELFYQPRPRPRPSRRGRRQTVARAQPVAAGYGPACAPT